MKIDFTQKDYPLLVTMIEIADWVIHAHYPGRREDTLEYRALRKKILAHYREMGMAECYTEADGEYYETAGYEEDSPQRHFIEEYDEQMFWEELVARLVDRDMDFRYGDQELSMERRFEAMSRLEEYYWNEIEKDGLVRFSFVSNEAPRTPH